jgi:hypothetical protein
MILIVMILTVEDRGWIRTYLAAPEPVTLVDIVPVGVVTPLDAVQRGCSAELPLPLRTPGRRWSHRSWIDRAVAWSLPKNLVVALHPSKWTRRRRGFGGLLSLFPCSQEPGRGSLGCSGSVETYTREKLALSECWSGPSLYLIARTRSARVTMGGRRRELRSPTLQKNSHDLPHQFSLWVQKLPSLPYNFPH